MAPLLPYYEMQLGRGPIVSDLYERYYDERYAADLRSRLLDRLRYLDSSTISEGSVGGFVDAISRETECMISWHANAERREPCTIDLLLRPSRPVPERVLESIVREAIQYRMPCWAMVRVTVLPFEPFVPSKMVPVKTRFDRALEDRDAPIDLGPPIVWNAGRATRFERGAVI